MLSIRPVLVRLPRQVVVDRLGEDLGAPARPAQRGAGAQGVRPGGVVRVEGGDELVDGHRPPGGGAHRPGGSRGGDGVAVVGDADADTDGVENGVISARTAVTRKSRPPGPGTAEAS